MTIDPVGANICGPGYLGDRAGIHGSNPEGEGMGMGWGGWVDILQGVS